MQEAPETAQAGPAQAVPVDRVGTSEAVVLDTNAVLDWQLFRHPGGRRLWDQLEAGALRWHACADMIGELELVWPRAFGEKWAPMQSAVPLASVLTWATVCPGPSAGAPPGWSGLQCSDRSDQKFIDLALRLGARWLVTRDRALLKLGPRAMRSRGLHIVTPDRWAAVRVP